jgi:hypothetical protein
MWLIDANIQAAITPQYPHHQHFTGFCSISR